MKIYKLASPLPLDEIPLGYGATQVDSVLDEWTIQNLDEQYSFKSYLGGGDWGVAYSTFDDKVVKITTDAHEFELAKELIGDNWQRHAPFARVYEAKDIGEETGVTLYVIVKELLRPLSEDEQYLFMMFMGEMDATVDNIKEGYEEKMPLFDKFEEYYMDVMNYFFGDVLNPGNVGWDSNGDLKAFDPRATALKV